MQKIDTKFRHTVVLISAFSIISLADGFTNRLYASPQQQAQVSCRALGPKALSGALVGAAGGAAAGAALGGVFGGRNSGRSALLGAGIGAGVGLLGGLATGSQADSRDCAAAQAALARLAAQPVGTPSTWASPTGSTGSYTPLSAEYAQGNQFCRQIRQTTDIAGHQPVDTTGIACRDQNGDYHTVTETASN